MKISNFENIILADAIPLLKDCPVIKYILGANFNPKRKKNQKELNAYAREAVLWSILVPIARLFFAGRNYTYNAPAEAHIELAEWAKGWLELNFSSGFLGKLK
jgi:hypothetical protein